MTTHCFQVAIFQGFADTRKAGAEHQEQAALPWNALLLPAAAVVKNMHGHSYALLIAERQILLRSNLLCSTLFLTARIIINS